MGEEVSWTVEGSVGGGVYPLGGRISRTMTRRFAQRGGEALESTLSAIGEVELEERLAGNDELDALVARAWLVAADSGNASKRRLLAKVVKAAVLDDAKVDESVLITGVLQEIDTPHIRCLEDVYRAEQAADAVDERGPVAEGAEREINQQVVDAGRRHPHPVLAVLMSFGLLDSASTYDGADMATGVTSFGRNLLADLRSESD